MVNDKRHYRKRIHPEAKHRLDAALHAKVPQTISRDDMKVKADLSEPTDSYLEQLARESAQTPSVPVVDRRPRRFIVFSRGRTPLHYGVEFSSGLVTLEASNTSQSLMTFRNLRSLDCWLDAWPAQYRDWID
jgi:hypothetical protein